MAMDDLHLFSVIDEQMNPKYVRSSLLMAKLALWEIRLDEAGELLLIVSKDFKDLLGWPEDEFPRLFRDYLDQCVHPEDRERVDEMVRLRLNSEVPGPGEIDLRLRHRRLSQWRWYRAQGDVGEAGPDGRLDTVFGCVSDIHETRVAQDELRASEEDAALERKRLDAIIEASGIVVWDWNLVDNTVMAGGRFFKKNPQGHFMAAKPVGEVLDRVMSRREQEKIMLAKDRYISGETAGYELEIELRGEKGRRHWGLDRAKIVEWDQDGRPIRMMGATLNIDSLKKTAEELAESQMYLEQVVESTNIAVWGWDLATDAITVNRNYAHMLGYELQQMPPTMSQLMSLVHPDDVQSLYETNSEIGRNPGESRHFNLRLRRRDGNYIWVFGNGKCLERDSSGRPARFVGTQMDFTHWKELENRQTESLDIISRQKDILEKQLAERLNLINEVQRQVESLVNAPGNRLDEVQKKLRREMLALREEIEQDDEETGSAFGRYMSLAFRFIANEMIWYKAVLDNLPFPTSVFDLTRRWYYLNQPAVEVLGGQQAEEFIGSHYSQSWKNYKDSDFMFLDDSIGKKSFIRRLTDSGRVFQCQSSFLLGENNRPLGLIETMQDITATHEAEERTRLMLDATPIAYSFFGRDGVLLDCNLAAAAICGLTDKAEYIEHFYEYMPPTLPDGREAPQVLKDAVREAFECGSSELAPFYLRHQDGVDIPGEIRLMRVEWRESHMVLGYFTDTRQLLATRQQLDQERHLLREILDYCQVCFSISRNNVVKFVTKHTQNLLNLNVGDHYSKLLDPQTLAEIRAEMISGGGRSLPWRQVSLKRPDGTEAPYMLTVVDVEFEGTLSSMAWCMEVDVIEKWLDDARKNPLA